MNATISHLPMLKFMIHKAQNFSYQILQQEAHPNRLKHLLATKSSHSLHLDETNVQPMITRRRLLKNPSLASKLTLNTSKISEPKNFEDDSKVSKMVCCNARRGFGFTSKQHMDFSPSASCYKYCWLKMGVSYQVEREWKCRQAQGLTCCQGLCTNSKNGLL